MATARPTLVATHRDITGKAVSRLRHAGKLPAVVYGHGEGSDNVTVDAHEFEQLRRHTGRNTLIDLSVDGGKARPVLVNGVQVHPVNRRPLHVDLFLVKMTEELTVDVPLIATGDPAGRRGQRRHAAAPDRERQGPRAAGPPARSRSSYAVDSLVDFDTTIHVRDLTIPGDVTLVTDGDEIIAKVQAPRVEVEEAPVVAEGEEGAEGEAAEGEAAGGESAGGDSSDEGDAG